jgi:aspartyl-tRNA(Asn)/glutamyl-tRNA(Gln) amidotransferase subunit A
MPTFAPSPAVQRTDLVATRSAIASGQSSAAAEMEKSIAIAQSGTCQNAFVSADFESARLRAAACDQARLSAATAFAATDSPLAGLAVSVKDLFDVAGHITAAGSKVLARDAPAVQDGPAVARLQAAGGALLGRTHMVEFAFSGVGTNPHCATPLNPADLHIPRVSGGSSSGAAVSVASGAVFVGLGSDTGGSIRIPAALCGIVGFKPTARLVPTAGTVPLSSTLDTVCAMTRSVRDAVVVHEVLSRTSVTRGNASLRHYRLAVARTTMLDALDATVAKAFERTLATLRAAGAQIVDIALHEIADLGQIQSKGGFSAAEALAWHRARGLWPAQLGRYDPRVAQRIALGEAMSAADYITLCNARQSWMARTGIALQGFDAVLSPTVPIVAPPLADVAPATDTVAAQHAGFAPTADAAHSAARDAEFFRVNALLLRNTSVVNMLDGCAISLPCHAAGELPVGLMVWHGALRDDGVLNVALQAEAALHDAAA